MKNLNQYVIEKFRINKNTKLHKDYDSLSQDDKDKITDKLLFYFQGKGCYQNKTWETRLEIVDKYFNGDICEFFDKADLWDDIIDYIGINVDDSVIVNYINDYKEELYKEIDEFVLR